MNPVKCAAILAGGASRRMGQNKALLEVKGEPLIRRVARTLSPLFSHIIVVTGDEETANAAGVPSLTDEVPSQGPMAGIQTALRRFEAPIFCVACDMPFLNPSFIAWQCEQLEEYEAVVPRLNGRAEPLHAVYAPACLPILGAALQEPRVPSLQRTLKKFAVRWIEESEIIPFDSRLGMFDNWNTPEDMRDVPR